MSPWLIIIGLATGAMIFVALRVLGDHPPERRPEEGPPPSAETAQAIAGAFVVVLLAAAAAVFWFGIYDTAEGRCNRGDLGACIVLEAQRSQP